jgi:hypothetical protein
MKFFFSDVFRQSLHDGLEVIIGTGNIKRLPFLKCEFAFSFFPCPFAAFSARLSVVFSHNSA